MLSLIASYGTASIAANAVATFQVLAGGVIGTATVTVVGQCVGASVYKEAEYYIKKLKKIVYVMMGFSHLLGTWLGLGVFGVWVAMTIDWLCRSICFTIRFKSGKWKEMQHV